MARVRRRKNTHEKLKASPLVIHTPHALYGNWHTPWQRKAPLAIEIGCGRSRFLTKFAKTYPEKNCLGMDIVPEIIVDGLERWGNQASFPTNIRYLWLSAEHMDEIFAPGEVAEIYLNFSDPWPKNRHAKRRLTHQSFLDQYAYILSQEGFVHVKTDSKSLFEFSLNEFARTGWQMQDISLDLYKNLPQDNIETEYERRFVKQGKEIYRLKAFAPKKSV